MCGIVGLSLPAPHTNAARVVSQMAESLRHRGPDSAGTATTQRENAWVGFRRLAIQDLDHRADQPMVSASGRTMIVFNGEIYNATALASKYLPHSSLRTTSDTEIVLELLEQRGDQVLAEFNGMFALAFVDRAEGTITLARDRMGKKPLYLYEHTKVAAFASELRAIKPFGLHCDPSHAELFFHFGYFPSPFTFFRHTTQLRPGEVVKLRDGCVRARRTFHTFTDHAWGRGAERLETLDELLQDATRLRLVGDVPVGAFLSGGIDSGLVAAQLASLRADVPTYTIAFPDQSHDEQEAAADTARELGLSHETIRISESELPSLAADFLDCYEQPYADTSGLVTLLLCRHVKQRVTVALSGDGGDEFFGGYARYSWFRKALLAQQFPRLARRGAAWCLPWLDHRRGRRLARWLATSHPAELYAEIIRNWHATRLEDVLARTNSNSVMPPVELVRQVFDQTHGDPLSQAACFDATYYIPDDLQVKLDRASMRCALEVRCPMLDPRIAAWGISLTSEAKYADGQKSVLKQLVRNRISPAVAERPKQGFSVPLGRWLRGPLRDFCDASLRSSAMQQTGWLRTHAVERVWKEFLAGKVHYAHNVWMLLGVSQHLRVTEANPLFLSLKNAQVETSGRAA